MNDLFNQRGPRPANEMYYFQLVPGLLTIQNPSLVKNTKTSNTEFRLKMIKGNQLCDEMKKSVAVKAVNGKAAFDKVQLNFNLPSFNPNRNIEFTLILLKFQEGEGQNEVGKYSIMSSEFILEFKKNETRVFQTTVNMSQDYALSFELFVDNSRFALEKFIKERKDDKKQEKIQNMLQVTKKGGLRKQNPPSVNQARSEKISDNEKVQVMMPGQERFTSPARRIVRKQSQSRKLMRKQSSPGEQKSQTESNSRRELKFLTQSTKQDPIIQKKVSLAEQEVKKIQQAQKQQALRKELQKKERQAQAERRRLEEEATKKVEEARKASQLRQQRKVEAQRKRQQEEAARKAQQARKAAEQKRLQAQRKKQQQEAARKAQGTRKAVQQRRLQAQRKREQEHQRRFEQERKQNAKRQAELRKQEAQRKRQQQQQKRAEQQQRRKIEAQREAKEAQRQRKLQETKKAKQAKAKQISEIKQPAPLASNTRARRQSDSLEQSKRQENRYKKKESIQSDQEEVKTALNPNQNPTMRPRIKSITASQDAKYTFTGSAVTKQQWSKPVSFKKTGSYLFDNKGNPIKQSQVVEKKARGNQMDMKTKIIYGVFLFIALLLIFNAMAPSRRR